MLHRYERRRLNPQFVAAIRDSVTPRHVQATLAGFAHTPHLSYVLHTREPIPITPIMRRRLTRLAEVVGFPADHILLPASEPELESAR